MPSIFSPLAVADQQIALVDRLPQPLPRFARLARWDRPIGTWLLLLPCWWGLALAPGGGVWALATALLFALGAFAMRGAGCTLNDLADRDFDALVERTRNRPLAAGTIRPRQAVLFMALQTLVGAVVLFSLNTAAIVVGLLSLPLVAIYPFMKRITYWPQVFLGLAFNWGVLVAYAHVTGGLDVSAGLLYLAGIAWTLGYDTVYAHQDKADDLLVGVKSSALKLGAGTKPFLVAIYTVMLGVIALSGALQGFGPGLYLGLVPVAAWLARQTYRLDIDDGAMCLAAFRAHRGIGLLVVAALLLGKVSAWPA